MSVKSFGSLCSIFFVLSHEHDKRAGGGVGYLIATKKPCLRLRIYFQPILLKIVVGFSRCRQADLMLLCIDRSAARGVSTGSF